MVEDVVVFKRPGTIVVEIHTDLDRLVSFTNSVPFINKLASEEYLIK